MSSLDSRGYYSALNLKPSASSAEVKESYRQLAKRLHPDLNRGRDTTAEFQRINEAYSVLSDPSQRAEYDAQGKATGVFSSNTTRTSVYEIEPYTCVDCGIITPTLRHIKYTQVVSYIFGSHRTNIWGVFCDECASQRLKKASLLTGAFGWLSVPGMIFTAHALARNLSGGKQESAINMEVCARQAVYFASKGDHKSAKLAANAALEFSSGYWWSSESERRAKEVQNMINKLLRSLS